MTQIILDPVTNVYYSSFYIQGLIDRFGAKSIIFDKKPFQQLEARDYNFNFVLCEPGKMTRISIDFEDFDTINNECYEWCDRYGKVNTNWRQTTHEEYPKLISLAPGFGIRVWSLTKTSQLAISNVIKSRISIPKARKLLGKYKRQYTLRCSINFYHPELQTERQPYIYHVSTLWYSDKRNNNDNGVNKSRANFIRACKNSSTLAFEGGLVPQDKNRSSVDKFADVLYEHEVSVHEYIAKTQKSCIVFNTPAFWNCHGWKLGEYLALGKAIISLPLSNDLPAPLIHGENIHFIKNDSEEAIKEAILLLIKDENYRYKLERGARSYWENYGTPCKSIELLSI